MTGAHTPGQATLPTPNSTKSYWHKDPSKVLLGHRTTPSLPTNADLVIIGSGISGASAAHFLREKEEVKNLNIVMLEAREACWGATGRVSLTPLPSLFTPNTHQNGGHCQPLLYSAIPEVGAFELRNYNTIKSLIETNNIPCDWRSLTGVHAYMNASMFADGLSAVQSLQKSHPELAKLIKVVTKDSKNPSLADLRIPTAAGAFVQETAASLWPYKLVSWLLENLLSLNSSSEKGTFNLQTNTPATHLQKIPTGWIIHTPRGMLATPKILLTTNGYTSHLLPRFSDLIVPVRGEMSALLPPENMNEEGKLVHSYGFIGNGKQNINQEDYLIQRPFEKGGELMFGGGRSYAAHAGLGVSDDSSIDEPAAAYLRNELNVVLDLGNGGKEGTEGKELKASHEWSGVMGYSRDGHPWVGSVGEGMGGGEGLWVCAGFTGHGMPNTCLSAKGVVDMMCGSEADVPGCYLVSEERLVKARGLDEVAVADAKSTLR